MGYNAQLKQNGFITPIMSHLKPAEQSPKPNKTMRTDDYAAQILTLFLPYLDKNISEQKSFEIQDKLISILIELKKS